jgi:hypothetical protein
MSDPQNSETPLRTTFKIKLNGDTLAISTVGQAYQFLTNFKSVEWMEFRALHEDAVATLEAAAGTPCWRCRRPTPCAHCS